MTDRSTRKIGNEFYKKRGNADSKTEAKRIANRLRDDGHKTRIIHEKQGTYLIVAKSK